LCSAFLDIFFGASWLLIRFGFCISSLCWSRELFLHIAYLSLDRLLVLLKLFLEGFLIEDLPISCIKSTESFLTELTLEVAWTFSGVLGVFFLECV
jgi:hypothetical protein